jgi:peptidoglycan/LPS O-acetylase OafA/YrhL
MPLDGLRAIAILWVLSFHAPFFIIGEKNLKCIRKFSFLFSPVGSGDMGVDVFFSLSGFLIGLILFKELQKYDGQLRAF